MPARLPSRVTSALVFAILVVLYLGMDALPVYATLTSAAGEMRSRARRFPALPPVPGEQRREFKSFRLDLLNLSWSLHATLDATYLHLEPAWLLRRIGAVLMSIPRDRLTNAKRTLTGARAMLNATVLRGPRWCLLPS